MREADAFEVWASHLHTPEGAVVWSMQNSDECWAGLINGVPCCLFGVATSSLIGKVGCPWMLGTREIEKHAIPFLKRSKVVVDSWKENYDYLHNYVHTSNKVSIRWLRWLGFKIEDAEPYGALENYFHRFSMEGEHV